MFKLISATLLSAVVFSGAPVFAQAPAAKKTLTGGSVTTTDIRGSGNTVIVSGNGPGSVQVFTQDKGQGNRVIVTQNGKVVAPQKTAAPKLPTPRETRQAEREIQRTLDEVDRLLEQLDRALPR